MERQRATGRITRRDVLHLGLLGAAAAVLAACGAPAPAPTPRATPRPGAPGAAAPAPVKLTWATPGNPAEAAVYEKVARHLEALQPGLTIATNREAAVFDTLTALTAAGTMPDLLFSTINNWPALADQPVLRPLDDLIRGARVDLADFYPQIIRPYRYDEAARAFGQGKLYGLPKEVGVRVMYYNADLFRRAGVTPPPAEVPFTWEQYLDACRKTTQRDGDRVTQYGYVPETWWGMWAIWAWANGGQVVDDAYQPTRATMDEPATVAALAFWAELVTRHKVAAPPAVTKEQGRAEMFAAGQAATYNNGRWMVPLFRTAAFAWDVMPMPRAAKRAQLLTGSLFGISQASLAADDAWRVLSYVTGVEGQVLLTELGVLLPSRRSVAESDVFLKVTPPVANRVFLDEIQYGHLLPLHRRYPPMEKAVNEEVELLLSGARTPAEAAAAMTARVNALLKA